MLKTETFFIQIGIFYEQVRTHAEFRDTESLVRAKLESLASMAICNRYLVAEYEPDELRTCNNHMGTFN